MPRQNTIAQSKYKFVSKLGSGAFADVIEASETSTGQHFAIKKMKQAFESVDEVERLPELQILKLLQHQPFAVCLEEILFDRQTGKLALVLELMEDNIYEAFKEQREPLAETLVQLIFFQCCCGVYELHSRGWMHRDIKPENYLIRRYQDYVLVKLADFGSVTEPQPGKLLTEYISTRWYRAPEILLTDGDYGYPADIFALGCILFELLANVPLFAGKDELDELVKEQRVIGVPSKQVLQRIRKNTTRNPIKQSFVQQKGSGVGGKLTDLQIPAAIDLIEKMIQYDPADRIEIAHVLEHPYFTGLHATLQQVKSLFPEASYQYLHDIASKFVAHAEVQDTAGDVAEACKKISERKTRERQRKQAEPQVNPPVLQGIKKHVASSPYDGKLVQMQIPPVELPAVANAQVNLPQIIVRKK